MKNHYKPLSRFFPKGHIREGQPTYFVEKLWESIYLDQSGTPMFNFLMDAGYQLGLHGIYQPKHHTIRQGNSVKVGDKIQFYVWSGKPYRSKWILIAEPIEVKKVWDFEIKIYEIGICKYRITVSDQDKRENYFFRDEISYFAANDGLSFEDFKSWFGNFEKDFQGQIICWSDDVNY